MNRQGKALTLAIAATLGSAGAEAATYQATLTSITSYSSNGSSAANLTSSTATFEYDDVTNLLTQTGGTLNERYTISPITTLFRHLLTGTVIGNGGAATASTYECVEGNFGTTVGASLCGNYNFGGNYANESTLTYGPGTTVSRTIGGDDMSIGDPQSIAALNGMNTVSFDGTTLVLSNATPQPTPTSGYRWQLSTTIIPVPAAAWLIGPAVLAAGRFARRRRSTAA